MSFLKTKTYLRLQLVCKAWYHRSEYGHLATQIYRSPIFEFFEGMKAIMARMPPALKFEVEGLFNALKSTELEQYPGYKDGRCAQVASRLGSREIVLSHGTRSIQVVFRIDGPFTMKITDDGETLSQCEFTAEGGHK